MAINEERDMTDRRSVIFPIIGDDEILEKDTRIIMTNQQLLTRNPSAHDEASFGTLSTQPSKAEKVAATVRSQSKYDYSVKPKVSYSTQHRPLGGKHGGESSFDKMPKKTSVDEAKDRAKRIAATIPERPKGYVHPLERKKEDVTIRKNSSAVLNKKIVNDNPIQDMKKRGMNVNDALKNSKNTDNAYFESKRKNLFDRGIV